MRRISSIVTLFTILFSLAGNIFAKDIQTVSNITELVNIVNSTWVSNSVNTIMPPGDSEYANSYGAVSFTPSFDTNFIASLLAVTNSIGTNDFLTYPLEVSETTGTTGRVRNYYSAISTNPSTIHYETVDMTNNYPISWIENVFGEAPQWLSGTDLQKWYDDRDPWRQHVYCDLIATGDVPNYLAMLTNTYAAYTGTNTNSTLSVYSNNIVFFDTVSAGGGNVGFYLHAPTNIPSLDLFSITNLLDVSAGGSGWKLAATMEHNLDPVLCNAGIIDPLKFFCAGNSVIDSDGDGLSDARELKLYGTDVNLADSDGDGINDGMEILTYGLNPLSSDTDSDGINDADEYFGLVAAWGWNYHNQCDVPIWLDNVIAVDAGYYPVSYTHLTLPTKA